MVSELCVACGQPPQSIRKKKHLNSDSVVATRLKNSVVLKQQMVSWLRVS